MTKDADKGGALRYTVFIDEVIGADLRSQLEKLKGEHTVLRLKGGVGKYTLTPGVINHIILPHEDADHESASAPAVEFEPPVRAEFCLSLLFSGVKGEALLGDLNERFNEDCKRYGGKRARRLYWARTLHSLWPLFRLVIARAIKCTIVINTVRRFF
jgi:hypothetical protein